MFARPESFESMDSEASFRLGSSDETLLAVEDGARSTGDTPQAKQEPTKSPMSAISSGGSSLGGPSPDLWKKRGMETSPVSVLFIPELRVNVDTDTDKKMDEEEDPCTPITPLDDIRQLGPLPVFGSAKLPPPTPARKKTPGGTAALCRQSSLMDTKVLVSTQLKRTGSDLSSPNEFLFEAHFDFLQVIGRSAQAEVWLARSKESGNTYAVKKCLKSFHSKADRQNYVHEVEAVARLPEHQNVVKYYRGWQQDQHFYMQMEHCAHGSFASLCQRLPQSTLVDEGDIWSLASQVATGLAFIHRFAILHLDVKPDNIFVDAQGTYKLGDFGLAWMPGQGWEWQDGDGAYVAPELLRLEASAAPTPAADVFSLGAMLYEATVGSRYPRNGDLPAPLPPHRSQAVGVLIEWCLKQDPAERPSAQELVDFCARHRPQHAILTNTAPSDSPMQC